MRDLNKTYRNTGKDAVKNLCKIRTLEESDAANNFLGKCMPIL
jgi:hypothetical protein